MAQAETVVVVVVGWLKLKVFCFLHDFFLFFEE